MQSRLLKRHETQAIKKRLIDLRTNHTHQARRAGYSRPHFCRVVNGKAPATNRFFNFMENIGIPPHS